MGGIATHYYFYDTYVDLLLNLHDKLQIFNVVIENIIIAKMKRSVILWYLYLFHLQFILQIKMWLKWNRL
jgi:hypothetical protein